MSREFQERFLREQIAEYDQLLTERTADKYSKAKRNIIKQIEKQKAAKEAEARKDRCWRQVHDGLVFTTN